MMQPSKMAFKWRSMKSMPVDHLLGNGSSRLTYDQTNRKTSTIKLLPGPSSGKVDGSLIISKQRKFESVFTTINKLVKKKLSFAGGVDKVFRQMFSVREGEEMLRASHCCLYTTAGPIVGRLFISTEKLAFCSDRPIAQVSTAIVEPLRFHYKIVIPLMKIQRLSQNENMKNPSQKYLQIVTADDYEFWFMGFRSYTRTFKCLQQACSLPAKLKLLTSY